MLHWYRMTIEKKRWWEKKVKVIVLCQECGAEVAGGLEHVSCIFKHSHPRLSTVFVFPFHPSK